MENMDTTPYAGDNNVIPLSRDAVIPAPEVDTTPYAHRAREIAACLKEGDDHVLDAATKLHKLYDQYRNDTVIRLPWPRFCEENLSQWSVRYIYKLIEIGRAPDPAAALRKWREDSLHRSKKHRKSQKENGKREVRTSPGTAEDVWRQYYALSPAQKKRFDTWWRHDQESAHNADYEQAAEYDEAT